MCSLYGPAGTGDVEFRKTNASPVVAESLSFGKFCVCKCTRSCSTGKSLQFLFLIKRNLGLFLFERLSVCKCACQEKKLQILNYSDSYKNKNSDENRNINKTGIIFWPHFNVKRTVGRYFCTTHSLAEIMYVCHIHEIRMKCPDWIALILFRRNINNYLDNRHVDYYWFLSFNATIQIYKSDFRNRYHCLFWW